MLNRRSFIARSAAAIGVLATAKFSTAKPIEKSGWSPSLTPTQRRVFDDTSDEVLAYGGMCVGKTTTCLHSLIRHCHEEKNALALIIAPTLRCGKEGVVRDLHWALDVWRNGNWRDEYKGIRSDVGIGLDSTIASLDPQTKDRTLYIGNIHGGWGKVVIAWNGFQTSARMTHLVSGIRPSFGYIQDIDDFDNREIIEVVSPAIGRRRGVSGPQQLYMSCIPPKREHWATDMFFNSGRTTSVHKITREESAIITPTEYFRRLSAVVCEAYGPRWINGDWKT